MGRGDLAIAAAVIVIVDDDLIWCCLTEAINIGHVTGHLGLCGNCRVPSTALACVACICLHASRDRITQRDMLNLGPSSSSRVIGIKRKDLRAICAGAIRPSTVDNAVGYSRLVFIRNTIRLLLIASAADFIQSVNNRNFNITRYCSAGLRILELLEYILDAIGRCRLRNLQVSGVDQVFLIGYQKPSCLLRPEGHTVP